MEAISQHGTILVVARDVEGLRLRQALDAGSLASWGVVRAKGLDEARHLLQHGCCELLLLDQGFGVAEERADVVRLADRQGVHVVAVPEAGEESAEHAHWLNEALCQAARASELERQLRLAHQAARESRRQALHLARLLWEVVPTGEHPSWFTERYVLERLEEEVCRAERYHTPLSVAVGEVIPAGLTSAAEDGAERRGMMDRIARGKRRTDVAGQYGPHGFLLLLPGTPESGAAVCCRRLQGLLEQPATAGSPRAFIGIASHEPGRAAAKEVLRRAEEHLERAQSEAVPESRS